MIKNDYGQYLMEIVKNKENEEHLPVYEQKS